MWGMSRYQWLVFFAAWLGWGFDVFDGLLFNFVAPVCVPSLLGVVPGEPAGIFLAGVMNDLFTKRIPATAANPDLAWRVVFLSGLLPAAVALWIRRHVREPDAWLRARGPSPRLAELFTPALRRSTLGGLAMCLVTLVPWWATHAFLPFVVAHLAGPEADAATVAGHLAYASGIFNLGGVVGTVATIPLARLGRRPLFALYFLGAAAAIWGTSALGGDPLVRLRRLLL